MMDMKTSRFSEEQIIGFLRQAEAGVSVKEVCRAGGFSDATFYDWRAKFVGMESTEATRLRGLECDNAKLEILESSLVRFPHPSTLRLKHRPRSLKCAFAPLQRPRGTDMLMRP
jgi:putative transposase